MKQKIERLRSLMEKATELLSVRISKCSAPDKHHTGHRIIGFKVEDDAFRYLSDGMECLDAVTDIIEELPTLLSHIDALEARVEKANADSNRLFNIAVHHEDRADAAERALAEAVKHVRRLTKITEEVDEYQTRPERGDYGVECACCMGEMFDKWEREALENARAYLKGQSDD